MSYIPDITDRFPEGYCGVDMTPSFFGEPVDYSRAYGYEPSYEELVADGEYANEPGIPYENEPPKFEVDDVVVKYGFDGGYSEFRIIKINKERTRVLVKETRCHIDGCFPQRAQWRNLKEDELGEKFQPDYSYDEWIRKE